MKLFILDTHDGVKVYYSEDDVAKFITNQKLSRKDTDYIRVTELEAEVKSQLTGSDYLSNFQSQLKRENKLESMLGSDYATNVERLKDIVITSGKDMPQKTAFLSKLEITNFDKKSISKLLTGHANYILYEVPIGLENSVDYFKLVLKLHGFRKIEEKFVREIYNKSGYLHSRGYCVTPERVINDFNEAKK